jgi:hypothetical protein
MREGAMAGKRIPRLALLKRAAASTAVAATIGASAVTPSEAQIDKPSVPTGPVLRSADLILKNGNIITVDASFTIAQAIAIAGDRIVAVGSEAAVVAHAAPGTRVGKVALPSERQGRMSWHVMARTNHVNRVTSPLRVRTMLHLLSDCL